MPTKLHKIARFPSSGDNACIALVDLQAGTRIQHGDTQFDLQHDILTGHRFAVVEIKQGSFITSWNYPFGTAARDIAPGEYLCNQNVLFRLSIQTSPKFTSLKLPRKPNFVDDIPPFSFDAASWVQPTAVAAAEHSPHFLGYDRGERGVGTRNHLVIVNTSASSAPLVERLEEAFKTKIKLYSNVDAVIGLRQTESPSSDTEEQERTLRTLCGLLSNPNVGGFLAIDSGLDSELRNDALIEWMSENGVPIDTLPYESLSESGSFEDDFQRSSAVINALLQKLNQNQRSEQSIRHLRIGLQCGASDAFSGVCGNVLSAAIGREVIRCGGNANLTETPELSGAEDYTLSSIAEPGIADRFLSMLERFKTYLAWHGGTVDKNPSEGNLLGGLYNITLKSLGAAVKRDPMIPIEHIIEYGERMTAPGFYFMDGMGGDIASYTGQAAAGCNIILFVTGRGSPTSSSIVPTVKIVNTTHRYQMMAGDIDINAGQYLDGQAMDDLTEKSLQLVTQIASGVRTKGEKHDQNIDLLWRRKYFHTKPNVDSETIPTRFDGMARQCLPPKTAPLQFAFDGRQSGLAVLPKEKVGLIIPTVGCSQATAQQAVERLNRSEWVQQKRVSRFIVLAHTEGCGVTTGSEVLNFLLSYANHPQVEACLFLSLGCEMMSPSFIHSTMRGEDIGFPEITAAAQKAAINPEKFGWVTIQEAGGTEHCLTAVEDWFVQRLRPHTTEQAAKGRGRDMRIGISTTSPIAEDLIDRVSEFVRQVIAAGGSIVLPESSRELQSTELFQQTPVKPSLAFAQSIEAPGLHLMQSITENPIELVTGLGAVTDVIIHFSETRPIAAHPLTPTLNITASSVNSDFDLHLDPEQRDQWPQQIANLAAEVLSGRYRPRQNALGHTGNQIPRGPRAHAI